MKLQIIMLQPLCWFSLWVSISTICAYIWDFSSKELCIAEGLSLKTVVCPLRKDDDGGDACL